MSARSYNRLVEEEDDTLVAVDRPSLTDSKMRHWGATDLATMKYPLTPEGEHVRRDVLPGQLLKELHLPSQRWTKAGGWMKVDVPIIQG